MKFIKLKPQNSNSATERDELKRKTVKIEPFVKEEENPEASFTKEAGI